MIMRITIQVASKPHEAGTDKDGKYYTRRPEDDDTEFAFYYPSYIYRTERTIKQVSSRRSMSPV